jgi:hypothetical protein
MAMMVQPQESRQNLKVCRVTIAYINHQFLFLHQILQESVVRLVLHGDLVFWVSPLGCTRARSGTAVGDGSAFCFCMSLRPALRFMLGVI